MTRRSQLYLYFHGTLFIVIAMTAATLPLYIISIHRGLLDIYRQFVRSSHLILVVTGVWMVASAGMLPLLNLTQRWVSAIVWTLVASGYTFIVAIVLYAVILKMSPDWDGKDQWIMLKAAPYYLGWVYIVILTISGLTSLFPGMLMAGGTYKALRQYAQNAVH
jgi:hypothetical protein